MDPEKIIQDLIDGALRAGGRVERKHDPGHAAKLAGLGGGLGGVLGPVGSLLGAGLQDDSLRSGAGGGLGSLVGGGVGGLAGRLGAAALAGPVGLGELAGALGGSVLGGHLGQSMARPKRSQHRSDRNKESALGDAYSAGHHAAFDRFKVAFLGAVAPLLGSVAGPALARAGLGRVAPAAARALGSGLKGQMFDAAASTAGGIAGQHLSGPTNG